MNQDLLQSEQEQRLPVAAEVTASLSEVADSCDLDRPSVGTVVSDTHQAQERLTFPNIMSGAAGAFADTFKAYMEPPAHFFYMSYLTCLGNQLTKRLIINSEISPEPRFYIVIIGESADDRKSTAITKTTAFFEQKTSDFSICHGVGSAEGLQIQLTKKPKIVLCFDEFKAFVSKCKIESSVLLPCVTTLFESDRYEAHTAKSSIVIKNASLSILAACTTDTYEQIMDTHFLAIGFPNRLFLVPGHGQRRFSFPNRIPESEKAMLGSHLRRILDFVGERRELEITENARRLFHDWYMALPQSVHAKRLDTYAMRFMGLLAVNDLKPSIDEETVRKVIDLCDWQLRVRRCYDPIDADSVVARLEEKIRRVLQTGPKKKRELSKAVNAHRSGLWMFNMALSNLLNAGQIAELKKTYRFVHD